MAKCKHCHSTRTTEGVAGGRVCRGCNAPMDTPAAMLGEALEHLRAADRLSRSAGWPLGLERAMGDAEDALGVLKRETEAREGREPYVPGSMAAGSATEDALLPRGPHDKGCGCPACAAKHREGRLVCPRCGVAFVATQAHLCRPEEPK